MTKRTSRRPHTLIRWMLRYGKDFLTCAVYWQPATSTYLVSVVANGIESAAMVETVGSSVEALNRHAAIVAALRMRGWTILAYSDARSTASRQSRIAA